MKLRKYSLSFYSIIFMLFCQVFLGVLGGAGQAYAVDVDDFYFESFTGDYYLSRDDEGVSHLEVIESAVAVFPSYRQNKGICRQIPFTNQDGANITLPRLTRADITVTRNGAREPVYSIEENADYYEVCTGTEEYLLGRQEYTFGYEFEKVVTDFQDYQELYWDANGNGAAQGFGRVTARVHFVGAVEDDFTGNSWCYVGRYGDSGQDRCTVRQISDGVEFTARNLSPRETLTFDVELLSGSFVVPVPDKSYVLVFILVGAVIVGILVTIYFVKKFLRVRDKRKFYKGCFVKPEYQPDARYFVAEMAEIYLGKKKDGKIGVLLDMIVGKRVKLVRREKKKWAMVVENAVALREEERILLEVFNEGAPVADGAEIDLKVHRATQSVIELGRKYNKVILAALRQAGLVEQKYQNNSKTTGEVLLNAAAVSRTVITSLIVVVAIITSFVGYSMVGYELVLKSVFPEIMILLGAAFIATWSILGANTNKYELRTKEGLKASRYMDGLKLYIEMAETERMKFLQSVDGTDTSADGVVKLYEKLLPYAAVFGLEKSWMKELEKYYQAMNMAEPDWCPSGASMMDIIVATRLASTYAGAATGGAIAGSSGGSGGGGGGFAGGGGGGGGFGGR